ncbi:Hypothetical predicted protein, partial [Paramuricea clavata]
MPTQDEILVLLEEVARTNRTLNNENRLLREELTRRDVENKAVLKKLEEKIDSVTSSSENGSPPARKSVRRRRTKTVRVPAQCRRTTKKVYQALGQNEEFGGFDMGE